MDIEMFLDCDDVMYTVPYGKKEEVISSLVDFLAGNHPELDRTLILQSLLERERLRSTGVDYGVAFPHARVGGLKNLLACFGICRNGVDFDSFDGSPTHFFFVLLIPDNMQGTHLRVLARLSRMFTSGTLRHKMMNAVDPDALFDIAVRAYNGEFQR